MKRANSFAFALASIALISVAFLFWQHWRDQSIGTFPVDSGTHRDKDHTPFVTRFEPVLPDQPFGKRLDGDASLGRCNPPANSSMTPKTKLYGEIETTATFERPLPDHRGIERVRLVRADFKYPLLRVEERFDSENGAPAGDPFQRTVMVADHVILSLGENVDPRAARTQLDQMGLTLAGTFANDSRLIRVKIPATSVDDLPKTLSVLRATDTFANAEPDYLVFHHQVVPNDPRFNELWAHRNTGQTGGIANADIRSTEAWSHVTGSEQVIVAIIDTGVDYGHPDLAGNIYTNSSDPIDGVDSDHNGYIDDNCGWNFYAATRDPMDDHFHGTHVAGTVGASGDNAAGVVGVTWRTRLLPLKFLSANGSGATSDAISAIRYAADNGARILNNSWGGGGYSTLLEDAIRYSGEKGCLCVVAAGNNGADADLIPMYPAAFPLDNIISIAATTDRDKIAEFSNFGQMSVDLAAPGVGILSTFPRITTAAMTAEGLPALYASLSGTSMAAPHVSGAAALLLSIEPGLNTQEIKSRILTRGDYLPSLSGFCATSCRLNVLNLVDPSWQPRPALLSIDKLRWNEDPALPKDGLAGPSERLELLVEAVNVGHLEAADTSLHFEILSGRATLLNGPDFSLGTLNSNERKAPAVVPAIRIDDVATDGEIIRVRCTSHWGSFQSTYRELDIPIVKLPTVQASVPLPFNVGEIYSPTDSNLVYFVSPSEWRLYAFNTEAAAIIAVRDLDPMDRTAGNALTGGLAISPAGDRLYVALTGTQRIQSFSLPDLTPASSFLVDFGPDSLAIDSQGRLYATACDGWNPVRQLDPNTGRTTATSLTPGNGGLFYKNSLLRTNESHERLFLGELRLRATGGPGYVTEWDTSAPSPFTSVTRHPMINYFMNDFIVDDLHQQLLTVHSAIYGVQVTSMESGSYGDVWALESQFPTGVTHHPDGEFVFAGTRDAYNALIRRFHRGTGENFGAYRVMPTTVGTGLKDRGIAVTQNGRVFYISENGATHYLNLIGVGSVSANVPPIPPLPPRIVLSNVEVSDTGGNANNTANPGETISLIPTLNNIGASVSQTGNLSISTGNPFATFPAGTSAGVPAIHGGGSVIQPGFSVLLDQTIPSGTLIDFTLTYTSAGGASNVFGYRLRVEVPTTPPDVNPSTSTGLQFSGLAAHPTLNEVYLIDSRNLRVIAFGTSSRSIRCITPLRVSNRLIDGALIKIGTPAVSPDGSLLAVAMGEGREIQIYSLPDLSWKASYPLDLVVTSVAFDSMNRIHATGSSIPQGANWRVECLDLESGEVLFRYGPTSGTPYYLRASRDGTILALVIDASVILYGTSTGGVPTTISSFAATGSAITPAFARDIDIDPLTDLAYVVKGDGKITYHRISDGAQTGTWDLPQQWGCATRMAPGHKLYGVSQYPYGGGVREYNRATGQPLHDTLVSNSGVNSPGTIIDRGLDVTPNGRVVFIARKWNSNSIKPSVDGYDYSVSMLGVPCDLSEPGVFPLQLTALDVTDPSPANANAYPEPGETIWIRPTLKNVSPMLLRNITVALSSSNPKVSIGAPAATSIPSLNGLESSILNAMPVTLAAQITDGEALGLSLSLTHDGTLQTIPLRLFASQSRIAHASADFAIGAMLGHPAKPICYVLDETHQRVVAIDTEAGNVRASAQLTSDPKDCRLALSPDGSLLFVSLGTARRIQILAAESLAAVDLLHVGIAPGGVAVGADGAIYADSINSSDYLFKINSSTAEGTSFGARRYAASGLLKTNLERTRLFVLKPGTDPVDQKVDRYVLDSSGGPVRDARFSYGGANDLAIDDQLNRIYLDTNGGIQVTDMSQGLSGTSWPSGVPFGQAVALLPGSPFVYVASGSSYNGRIRRFDRATGRPLADFPNVESTWNLFRGLAVTAGEKIVFASNEFTGNYSIGINGYRYYMSLTGATSLDLSQTQIQPNVNLGADRTLSVSSSLQITPVLNFAGSSGEITTSWRTLEGPGSVVYSTRDGTTTLSFSNTGRYHLEFDATMGTRRGSDRIWVNSTSTPQINITALYPDVIYHPGAEGGFTIRREGDLTQALSIQLAVGGTAIPGYDYSPLPSSVSIPSGTSSVNLQVKVLRITAGETIEVKVLPGAGYDPGIASAAWVKILYRTFEKWLAAHKAAHPDLQIDETSDNNGDGVGNVLEYLLGRHPLQSSAGNPLIPVPGAGAENMQFRYRALKSASGATLDVEFSPNLQDWHLYWANEPAIVVTDRESHDDSTETVTFILSPKAQLQYRKFVRLRGTLFAP